jgi:hypothetical protein
MKIKVRVVGHSEKYLFPIAAIWDLFDELTHDLRDFDLNSGEEPELPFEHTYKNDYGEITVKIEEDI